MLKHKPRVVVLFSGNNDLNAGKSVEKVHDDFRAFVAKLHKSLPETRLVSIGVNPSPRRWENATKIQELNRLLQADCEQDGLLDFVDVWEVMLGEDGQPRKALFVKDGLHLNDEGYRLWARLVRPYLAPKGQSDKNGLNRK